MEIKKVTNRLRGLTEKYKYAILVLAIGLALLLIPGGQSKQKSNDLPLPTVTKEETLTDDSLAQILQSVEGAGKVKVLLSIGAGEETIYQTDIETDSSNQAVTTVIITDSQRNESGLVRQVNPAAYQGAVVVCQGADSSAVRLAITQAVSKITGLGADAICVLKMQ